MPYRVRARGGWITGTVGEERGRGGRSDVVIAGGGKGDGCAPQPAVGASVMSRERVPACLRREECGGMEWGGGRRAAVE